jgi:hypothetical protein
VPTVILHVGDLDPSGCAIIDSAAEDVRAFVADLMPYRDADRWARFSRLAVTPEQIQEFDLPTAPPKASDRRGGEMAETVQAEALPPAELAAIVEDGIIDLLDLDARDQVLAAEQEHRRSLIEALGHLR